MGRVPTLREIVEQPLIGYRNCRATEIVVEQLRSTGREPHFVFRTDENGVVQGLAGAGIGVAILPRLAVDPNDESVRITDLGPRLPHRQIGIARHKDRYHSPAAKAFLATALERRERDHRLARRVATTASCADSDAAARYGSSWPGRIGVAKW